MDLHKLKELIKEEVERLYKHAGAFEQIKLQNLSADNFDLTYTKLINLPMAEPKIDKMLINFYEVAKETVEPSFLLSKIQSEPYKSDYIKYFGNDAYEAVKKELYHKTSTDNSLLFIYMEDPQYTKMLKEALAKLKDSNSPLSPEVVKAIEDAVKKAFVK